MMFKREVGNWARFRELTGVREEDFHQGKRDPAQMSHSDAMGGVYERALAALVDAQKQGHPFVLFTHGFFMQAFRLVLLFPDAKDRLLMQNFLRFHLVNLIHNIDSLEFAIHDGKIHLVEQQALNDFTLQGESSHA